MKGRMSDKDEEEKRQKNKEKERLSFSLFNTHLRPPRHCMICLCLVSFGAQEDLRSRSNPIYKTQTHTQLVFLMCRGILSMPLTVANMNTDIQLTDLRHEPLDKRSGPVCVCVCFTTKGTY